MDPLSVSASIIALLQLTSTVIGYFSDVKGAPKAIKEIRTEISNLLPILTMLQDEAEQAQDGDSWSSTLHSLNVPGGPFEQLRALLKRLEKKLAPSKGLQKFGKAIAWPFEKEEIHDIWNTIERLKILFNLARQNDHIVLSKAIKGDVAILNMKVDDVSKGVSNLRISEKQREINRWLSAPDPSSNYNKALKDHHGNTGNWFIESESYLNWLATPNSLLWIFGIPGCGKTVLSSVIIQHTITYCRLRTNSAVLYFYFDFNDASKQQHELMIRSLISQLCALFENLPAPLEALYSSCMQGQRQPTLEALSKTLREALASFEEPFIILDALDECGERPKLLAEIENMFNWQELRLKMLVTSRREKDIEDSLLPLTNDKSAICIQSALVDADIRAYIHDRLQKDSKLKKWQKQQQEIEDALMSKANGMFRWAACQLDQLRICRSPVQLRKALEGLPKTLDQTYERILCRIEEEDRQYAKKILQWLAFSVRPLHLEEVAEIVTIDINSNLQVDPDRRFADPQEVLEICPSLIVIEAAGFINVDIRLAHFSVKEYLISERIDTGPGREFGIQEIPSNISIAEDCLLYLLQFDELVSKKGAFGSYHPEYPLGMYAAEHWTTHALTVERNTGTIVELSKILWTSEGQAFVNWILLKRSFGVKPSEVGPPLYYASSSGLTKSVEYLLNSKAYVNAQSESYESALYIASSSGYFEMVQLLLDNGANVNAQGGRYGDALHAASSKGHYDIVWLLLENGADVNVQNRRYGNALYLASRRGHFEIVRLLLNNGADINAQCVQFEAPLHTALFHHHFEIVRLLLDNGADVNIQDGIEKSPLEMAAEECSLTTFQLLLDKGAEVNCRVLKAVACKGTGKMVQMLHNCGTCFNRADREGIQLVYLASQASNIGVLEKLANLGLGIEATDKQGRNCLHYAAMDAGESTVIWLLKQGSDPNFADRDGWTALHWAAKYCSDPDSHNLQQRTIAALEAAGATINCEFIQNWTPYEVAIFHGVEVIWTSNTSGTHQAIKPGKKSFKRCEDCRMLIIGPIYQCQDCVDFYYCFKCKQSSDLTHPGCSFLETDEEDLGDEEESSMDSTRGIE